MIKKAMILSAGLGTRLRPLTHHCPKPLVPILNRPMLEHHLSQLAELGVEEVAINLHYLPEQIQHHLNTGSQWGIKITYSLEQPTVLGTGGGLFQLQSFFEQESRFLIINGDILHQINLRQAIRHHDTSGAVATLLVRTHPGDSNVGSVDVDDLGNIKRVPEMPAQASLSKRMYTGIQILSPKVFEYLQNQPPPPSCILRTAYRAMLEEGLPISSYHVGDSLWKDIGNPGSYLSSQWDLMDTKKQANIPVHQDVTFVPPVWIGDNVEIAPQSTIGPYVVLGDRTQIPSTSKLEHTVMWEGTTWDSNEHLRNAIVYPGGVHRVE